MKGLKKRLLGAVAAGSLGWSAAANATVDWDSVYYGVAAANAEAYSYCASDPDPYTCMFYRTQWWAGEFFYAAYNYPEYSDERDTLLMIAIMLGSSS